MAHALEKNIVVVAAIDFGTTFTGFAFSYCHEYQKVFTSTKGGALPKDRVPTTILLRPDKKFHSFGCDAEVKYAHLLEEDEHQDWFYFQRFKLTLLRTKDLTRETTIYDTEGRPMSAMMVITMVIDHLKKLAENIICQTKKGIEVWQIQWMITIPVIWSASARQFMREAAIKAGIGEDRLRLVLEPEAASLFCSEQLSETSRSADGTAKIEKLSTGSKYILADLGGGTADICVHEIIKDSNIRELYRATGDDLGGTSVDNEFRQFLIKLVGADVLMQYQTHFAEEYLTLTREFETKKTNFKCTTEKLVFTFTSKFTELVQRELGESLAEIIPTTTFSEHLKFIPKRNKLYICTPIVEQFFKQSIDGIIKLLKTILQETHDPDIQTLLLVGGYSESPYLREKIQTEMSELIVILEPDARLAVMKGAVMMGYKPRTVVERRAQYSYGFSIRKPFIDGVHPECEKFTLDGRCYCGNIFKKQIEKGQILTYGQVFKSETKSIMKMEKTKRTTFSTKLYQSTRTDPKYCTSEEECSVVGEIRMQPPASGWPDMINTDRHLIVGETEFTVKVFNKSTGEEYEAKMEFL